MFLYAFVSSASISFPHLFLRSLNEVHRSSAIGHALIHPIFIHKILLFLGLDGFLSSEPVYVVAPIGATFLRQRATHLRVALVLVLFSGGEFIFVGWSLWSCFRLYIGASLCILTF